VAFLRATPHTGKEPDELAQALLEASAEVRTMKRRELKGAVVVLTGASSGIGRAAAFMFAGRGSRLVLAARDPDAVEAVAQA
jgi:NADPH:quinone reductase-like Zn-dependent oxidoreductase